MARNAWAIRRFFGVCEGVFGLSYGPGTMKFVISLLNPPIFRRVRGGFPKGSIGGLQRYFWRGVFAPLPKNKNSFLSLWDLKKWNLRPRFHTKNKITPASTPYMKLKISKESMWFGHKPLWVKGSGKDHWIVPPTIKISKRGNYLVFIPWNNEG